MPFLTDIEALSDGGFVLAGRVTRSEQAAAAGNDWEGNNDFGVVYRVSATGNIEQLTEDGSIRWPYGGISVLPDEQGVLLASHHRVDHVGFNGEVDRIAGGCPGFAGDGEIALHSRLWMLTDVVALTNNRFLISESGHSRIRLVNEFGVLRTLAGAGMGSGFGPSCTESVSFTAGDGGFSGDGGSGKEAELNQPGAIAVDQTGDIYIADTYNNRIRLLDVTP